MYGSPIGWHKNIVIREYQSVLSWCHSLIANLCNKLRFATCEMAEELVTVGNDSHTSLRAYHVHIATCGRLGLNITLLDDVFVLSLIHI